MNRWPTCLSSDLGTAHPQTGRLQVSLLEKPGIRTHREHCELELMGESVIEFALSWEDSCNGFSSRS